jgi:hypothetical protein
MRISKSLRKAHSLVLEQRCALIVRDIVWMLGPAITEPDRPGRLTKATAASGIKPFCVRCK